MGNNLVRHSSKEQIQIANQYRKICSVSLAIKEIQIKTSMRYLTLIRMAIIKRMKSNTYVQSSR